MRLAVLAGMGGVLALHRLPVVPSSTTLLTLAIGGGLLALVAWRLRARKRLVVTAFAVAVFAFAATGERAALRLDARLAAEWEGRDLVVEGYVASLPQPVERGVRFMFEVESVEPRAARLRGPVLLAWYNGLAREDFRDAPPIRAGERWRFTVRLKRPHGNANPHGFDFEAWLIEEDVRASGAIQPRAGLARLDDLAARPGAWIERARDRLRERLWRALPEGRFVGVLIALAIGDQRAIRPEDWQVFNRTGVSHLMSISGLHVTMLAALAAALVGWWWRRSSTRLLMWPVRKAALVGGLFVALIYCLLAGFGVPAQRTLYMLAVAAIALVADRGQSPSRVLAAALAVVLLLDPWAVLAAGFWLSFGAVAILFYAGRRAVDAGWFVAWLDAQWAITLALVPLTLAIFNQVSLVSPLANLVAIPVVSFVVTPLAILAALAPIDAIAWIAHAAVAVLMPLLEWASALPAAVWQQHAPLAWTVPLALVGAAVILAPRGTPARYAALPLFLPLVLVAPAPLAMGTVRVDIIDVGQGLAVLVRTRHHALLYDTGPTYGAEADAGSRVVVPFLRGEGVQRLDRLIVTHLDSDHSGGVRSILQTITPALTQSSAALDAPMFARSSLRVPCAAGEAWTWDGVRFEVLYPFARDYATPTRRSNNMSCVLRIEAGGHSILLTSDIEARDEARLVDAAAPRLKSDVVLMPHHGSRTSSTAAWLDAVGARLAIVAAGYRNRFGHPRPDVLERYRERRIEVLRTDESGLVRIDLSAAGIGKTTYRSNEPRYWR